MGFKAVSLAALADVSVSEGAPIDGLNLTYNNAISKWVAAGSGAGTSGIIWLGDGSDGSFTCDGIATPSWATLAANVYTLQRDVWLINLTINSGVTLITNGYRIGCTGTLLVVSGGVIQWNGKDGNGSTAGGSQVNVNGTLGNSSGLGGGNGGINAGSAASNQTSSIGGAGGAGGSGSGGAGGAGGTVSPLSATNGSGIHGTAWLFIGIYSGRGSGGTPNNGAGGGGGGGDGGTNLGGGGGGPGGIVWIVCKNLNNQGIISANGGVGATRGPGNNVGGGGGGGGGVVFLGYRNATNIGTVTANGGAFGTGQGTGTNGVAGSPGTVIVASI